MASLWKLLKIAAIAPILRSFQRLAICFSLHQGGFRAPA